MSFTGEDPFGKTVELTGKHIVGDGVIFRLGGPQMLIKDSTMILLADRRFMLFSLPDLKFLGYRGELGEGPDEFNYPQLVPSADSSLLCGLWETTNQKIYGLSKTGEIVPVAFPMQKGGRAFARTFQFNPAPGDYIFTDATPSGREISRATIKEDSTVSVRQIYDLDLDPQWKDRGKFTANNGFLAVNPQRDRMAYAYNYYKVIKFMDMEGRIVRTLDFGGDVFDRKTLHIPDGLDRNVTQYWRAYATDDYVYFYYIGKKPEDIMRERKEAGESYNPYMWIEQYDWNGNPVKRYKILGQSGIFAVDEKTGKLYVASFYDDDPFYVYDLPVF